MVWRIRVTIDINRNSKLAGTTMGKISFEGVVALNRAGLVSTFQTVYSARLQERVGVGEHQHSSLQWSFHWPLFTGAIG